VYITCNFEKVSQTSAMFVERSKSLRKFVAGGLDLSRSFKWFIRDLGGRFL